MDTEIREILDSMNQKIDSLSSKVDLMNEICVKNGGGRHVIYKRNEFCQMLYDRHSLVKLSENFYKYALVVLVALQIVQFFVKK
ncbi:MAG: hypothetical protein ABR980_09455 [Ignavibacteriaceae bacterium]|jgi:hypothetical protein